MTKVLYIGNNLQQKNSNISYIGVLGPLLEQDGYNFYYASNKRNKCFRLLDMIWSVFYYSKKLDYVLIDTYSTQNFYYALLVSQCCRLMNIPYIPILHGGNLLERLKSSPIKSKLLFNNSRANVAPSAFLKDSFEAFGYKKLRYIPNVIELLNYPFLDRVYDAPKLLWVRSFSKIYNPLLAIKVLKTLQELGFDASLCMVGPDTDGTLKQVEDLALKLNVNVKITGKLTKQQWIHLSQDNNIFINTTNVDNTPLSVIEAMALGLPIVSTNVGGIPFLIDDGINGKLVEKDNAEAMANAIIDIFKNEKERNQMIRNARKLSETFDWQRVKTQWNEILQNRV